MKWLPTFLSRSKKNKFVRKGPASKRSGKKNTDTAKIRMGKSNKASSIFYILSVLLLWAVCLFAVFYAPKISVDLVEGQQVATNIFASIDFDYVDKTKTANKREAARKKASPAYAFMPDNIEQTKRNFEEFFVLITKYPQDTSNLNQEVVAAWSNLDTKELTRLNTIFNRPIRRQNFLSIIDELGREGIRTNTLLNEVAPTEINIIYPGDISKVTSYQELYYPALAADTVLLRVSEGAELSYDEQLRLIARNVLSLLIVPTIEYDADKTRFLQDLAVNKVNDVISSRAKGSLLLKRGDRITGTDLTMLKAMNAKLEESQDYMTFLISTGRIGLASLFISCAGLFIIYWITPKLWQKPNQVFMVYIILSLNVILCWGSQHLMQTYLGQPQRFVIAAIPITLTPVLLSLLLKVRTSIICSMIFVLQVTLLSQNPKVILTIGLVSIILGALSVKSTRTRLQTIRAFLYPPIGIIIVTYIYLFSIQAFWQDYMIVIGVAYITALIILILLNILLPLLEYIFGLTSDITLLELSDLNHPLLKRLSLEAPGTYTHTMMVATLAEHAAEAVGANTLLTRVSCYFHDIGKLSNPVYFTENSFGNNMHEDLSPKMSAMIILNHVKEGLALAARYKLKKSLRDAIATHHGTSLVYYFYHMAKTTNALEAVGGESEFRYSGPLPKTPECTIISIADTCEAASRSLDKPTPEKIGALVDRLFKDKILDGQFDDTELTMEELTTVRESIKKSLRVMLHGRIAYPKKEDSTKTVRIRKEELKKALEEDIRAKNEKDSTLESESKKEMDKDAQDLEQETASSQKNTNSVEENITSEDEGAKS